MAQEGRLEYIAKRGYWVNKLTLGEIVDAYNVRATLEGMAWRFAAEKGLDLGTQKKLARCIDEGADIIKKIGYEDFDEPAWQRMNNRFYSAIVPAAGSHFLKTQVEQIISIPLATAYVVPNWGGS